MQIKEAINLAKSQGILEIEAHWLLLTVLGRNWRHRAWLLSNTDAVLNIQQVGQFEAYLSALANHLPLAYLLGESQFYDLTLKTDFRALVPRNATESLLELFLAIRKQLDSPNPCKIWDVGTGSGAIALAIKTLIPQDQIVASDISAQALSLARENAQMLGLTIEFIEGSWFTPLPPDEDFDLIVSNPPYIAEADEHLKHLSHEPTLALVGGKDGLDCIRQITHQAPAYLKPGGWLIL
ncbi:MAG: peptide chain release factor N(5)-glutamine methyltransferase, partial [Gammaproteobacteria bacterium]|nr:peptide chain release factor N(5)-glutamine methyltransferase [Gammaproteobacteria bacterium]